MAGVDLVEDCKKATSIHFFVSQESQLKTKKQNGYNSSSCSTALITNYMQKMSRQRPARSPSFARQRHLEAVLIKPQIV